MSFINGYCAAVGDVSRSGHGDIAEELMDSSGFCLNDLIRAELDEYDLEEIKKLSWPHKDKHDVREGTKS